jgi:predicted nicotinamide N-methyase
MTFIQLQVPPNAEVGDALSFTIGGKTLEIPVPEGSGPGDVLQIQVEGDDDDNPNCEKEDKIIEEKEEEGKVEDKDKDKDRDEQDKKTLKVGKSNDNEGEDFKVPLHESLGITLEMQCSLPAADSSNPSSEKTEEKNEVQEQEKEEGSNKTSNGDNDTDPSPTVSDGTYAMAWPAGLHLSKCISSPTFHKWTKTKKHIVEIGSGLGVVGLAFLTTASFVLSHRKNEVKKINLVLTDLPSALPLIKHNISWNRSKLSSTCGSALYENIKVEPLIWGDESSSSLCSLSGKVDMILASDILYNTSVETYQALCQTISSLVQRTRSRNSDKIASTSSTSASKKDGVSKSRSSSSSKCEILLSVRWRKPEEERKFFQLMESTLGYEFTLVLDEISDQKEEYKCNLHWTDYGNPACEKSNEYFTNTYVQSDGETIALKDVTEDHMDDMNEEEYTSFEARYIQIYIGRSKNSS